MHDPPAPQGRAFYLKGGNALFLFMDGREHWYIVPIAAALFVAAKILRKR